MMSPPGSALLYARPEVQALLEPLIVSWGWGNDTPRVTPFVDEQQIQGTRDLSAFLAVPAAIDFMAEHDWDAVRARCHDLVTHARQRWAAHSGLAPLTPDGGGWYEQMASLPLPPCEPDHLKWWLYAEHHIEVPILTWNERPLLRLSVQGYNTAQEVEVLLEALRDYFS